MTTFQRKRRHTWWLRIVPFMLIAMLAACSASGSSPSANATPGQTADDVRAHVLSRLKALVAADMPALNRLHAADYELIPPDGGLLSRQEFLGSIRSGELDYRTFKAVSPIRVRMSGQLAVVRYESEIDVVLAGIGRLKHNARHTDVYVWRHGDWRATWSQTTAVGPLPEPVSEN